MSPNIPKTMPQKSNFSLLKFLTYNSCHPFAPAGSPCQLSCWHFYSIVSTQHITINVCIMKILQKIIGTVSKLLAVFAFIQPLLHSMFQNLTLLLTWMSTYSGIFPCFQSIWNIHSTLYLYLWSNYFANFIIFNPLLTVSIFLSICVIYINQ